MYRIGDFVAKAESKTGRATQAVYDLSFGTLQIVFRLTQISSTFVVIGLALHV